MFGRGRRKAAGGMESFILQHPCCVYRVMFIKQYQPKYLPGTAIVKIFSASRAYSCCYYLLQADAAWHLLSQQHYFDMTKLSDKQTTHTLQCFDLQRDIAVDAFPELLSGTTYMSASKKVLWRQACQQQRVLLPHAAGAGGNHFSQPCPAKGAFPRAADQHSWASDTNSFAAVPWATHSAEMSTDLLWHSELSGQPALPGATPQLLFLYYPACCHFPFMVPHQKGKELIFLLPHSQRLLMHRLWPCA